MAISAKQQRFVDEYIIDLNATQAATRAGYSPRTAGTQGQRLLTNVEIQAAIIAAKSARAERTHVTQDRVLLELARIGFSDIRCMFTADGLLRPIAELDDATAAAISSVKVVTRPGSEVGDDGKRTVEHVHEIKLWDKNSALDKIAKHLDMSPPDRVEHTGKGGGPIESRTTHEHGRSYEAMTDDELRAELAARASGA